MYLQTSKVGPSTKLLCRFHYSPRESFGTAGNLQYYAAMLADASRNSINGLPPVRIDGSAVSVAWKARGIEI